MTAVASAAVNSLPFTGGFAVHCKFSIEACSKEKTNILWVLNKKPTKPIKVSTKPYSNSLNTVSYMDHLNKTKQYIRTVMQVQKHSELFTAGRTFAFSLPNIANSI